MRRKTRMLYRIKQIEKERVGQLRLTRAIYIKSLASWVPTKEENLTFEQQERSRKLGEKLEVILNFLRWIATTSTPTLVFIISNSKELEVPTQPIAEEQP
jgi:hypothetical protein